MLALGLVLLALAVLLLAAEAHLSTGGLIGVGAAAALISGMVLLLASAGVGWLAVVIVAALAGLVSVALLATLRRSLGSVRRLRPRTGVEAMIGHIGVVRGEDVDRQVSLDGGLWRAQPSIAGDGYALHDGDQVVIERVNGLTLHVRKAEEWELER